MDECSFDESKINTIYDAIVYVYLRLRQNGEEKYLERYYSQFQSTDLCRDERREIKGLLRNTLKNELYSPQQFIQDLVPIFRKDEDVAGLLCIFTLKEFDDYLSNYEIEDAGLRKIISYKKVGYIYSDWEYVPLFKDNFIMDLKNMKDAKMDKLNKGIWSEIKNYKIIKHPDNYDISIDRFNVKWIKNDLEENKNLKIAMVPFSQRGVFSEDSEGVKRYNPYGEKEENVYLSCISILEDLEKINVDIVIFPELVMTKTIVDRIQEWIMDKHQSKPKIKLIFLGSYYDNNINRCVLLAGDGSLLLSNDKRNAYEYENKSGKKHREQLGDFSKTISLIDIPGLGRVFYNICKDAIVTTEVMEIVGNYRYNFNVTSADTKGIENFIEIAESIGMLYGVFSAVSNLCSARKRKSEFLEIGFIGVPVLKKNHIKGKSVTYKCDAPCAEDDFCACAHIFDIDLDNKQIYGKGLVGVKIDQYCHFRNS